MHGLKDTEKAYKKLKHLINDEQYAKITYYNPKLVIENKEISSYILS